MKRTCLIVIFIIIIAGLAVLFFERNEKSLAKKQSIQMPLVSEKNVILETQINGEGGVTVKITPKISENVSFDMSFDTHSGELNDDIIKATVLLDENSKKYIPIVWEGSPPEGHHRSGILKFGDIAPLPKIFKIIIKKVGGINERQFVWTL